MTEYKAVPLAKPATACMLSVGWKSRSSVRVVVICVQEPPASTLRKIPLLVAARSVPPFGEMARRFTK
ncbi:MAG: hypothetical protein ACREA2_01500 [Blastocatellia bacterium]